MPGDEIYLPTSPQPRRRPPRPRGRKTKVPGAAAAVALNLGLVVTGLFVGAFGLMAPMAADSCGTGGFICSVAGQYTAALAPIVGAILGLIVGTVAPHLGRSRRPNLQWFLLAYGLQFFGFLVGIMVVNSR